MTLFRFVLARRRVLIYTRVPTSASRSSFNTLASRQSADSNAHRPSAESNRHSVVDQTVEAGAAPVVEPACVLARVAADICFGWKDGPGLGEGPEVLGMVGLDSIERLGEEGLRRSGWIACTTERIFLEKPYLYDLVVDLSPSLLAHGSATGPDDKPVLSVTVPSSSGSSTFKLAPTRSTYSDLKIFNDIERALYAQSTYSGETNRNASNASLGCVCPAEHEDEEGWVVWDRWGQGCSSSSHGPGNRNSCAAGMNAGPCSSGLNAHAEQPSESSNGSGGSAKSWVDPWRIYEEVCVFCAGVCGWIGWGLGMRDRGGGVQLDGPDDGLRSAGPGRHDPVSLHSISSPSPNSPTHLHDLSSPAHQHEHAPIDQAEHDRRRANRRAHVLELMTLFHKYAAFLHARLSDIIDSHDGQPQSSSGRKAKGSTASKSSTGSKSSFKSAFSHKSQASQSQALLGGVAGAGGAGDEREKILVLTSKDMLALDLSPLSAADAQFLEWFGTTIARRDRRVVVKRTWKDMVSAVVGSSW